MQFFYLIPIIFLVASLFFAFYITRKYKAEKVNINLDVERSKYNSYKQELLNTDFSYLKKWIKGKTIDAFTTATVPQSIGDKVQEMVTDGLKNVALSAIGIRLRRIETDCFWVLSGENLHFLQTGIEGELEEHIIFDTSRLKQAKLQYTGVLKDKMGLYLKSSEDYLPKTHTITFNLENTILSLEIHDRLHYTPYITALFNLKKQSLTRAKYQVVGEKLVSALQERFPNLNIT